MHDVADANRARDGRGERLEVGDLTRPLAIAVQFAGDDADGVDKTTDADEAEIAREEDRACDQPNYDQLQLCLTCRYCEKDDVGHRPRDGLEGLIDRLIDACRSCFHTLCLLRRTRGVLFSLHGWFLDIGDLNDKRTLGNYGTRVGILRCPWPALPASSPARPRSWQSLPGP